eukprot:PhF_6_TR34203/c0_g1_i2/m.50131
MRFSIYRSSIRYIQYLQEFLPHDDQCTMLRVCRRLQSLVLLPFHVVHNLVDRYEWYEPQDVLPINPRRDACSKMVLCQDRLSHQKRTMYFFHKSMYYSRRQWQQFQGMVDTLFELSYPCFANLYEAFQTKTDVVLVMETTEGTSIAEIVSSRMSSTSDKPNPPLPSHVIRNILWKVVKGVSVLHSHGIIHRTINADTVLYNEETENVTICGLHTIRRVKLPHINSLKFSTSRPRSTSFSFSIQPSEGNETSVFSMDGMVADSTAASFVLPSSEDLSSSSSSSSSRVFRRRKVPPPRPTPVIIPNAPHGMQHHFDPIANKLACVRRHTKAVQDRFEDGRIVERHRSFSQRVITLNDDDVPDESTTVPITPYGRNGYMAPELLSYMVDHPYSRPPVTLSHVWKIDNFSIGSLIWYAHCGKSPWTMKSYHYPNFKLDTKRGGGVLPREFEEVVFGLLEPNVSKRWTLTAVQKWLADTQQPRMEKR